MLNSTADFRPASITSLLSSCKFFMPVALALDMFSKSLLLQRFQRFLGAICRVSPHILTGIAEIKQFGKYLAVMNTGIGHFVTANKFVPGINADMVFITKERFAVLLRPTGIGIFLSFL